MTIKQFFGTVFSIILLSTPSYGTDVAENECRVLGGTGMADAIDENHFVASLSGGLGGGARATVTAQSETETGLVLGMEHHFFTDEGGLLHTKDKATLTAVPGKANFYMLEISYEILESSGAFEGYQGEFRSAGLFNSETGKVVLRYTGQICK